MFVQIFLYYADGTGICLQQTIYCVRKIDCVSRCNARTVPVSAAATDALKDSSHKLNTSFDAATKLALTSECIIASFATA